MHLPAPYAWTNQLQHSRAVYLRETDIMPPLDGWFAGVLRPDRLPVTIADLTEAQVDEPHDEVEKLRAQLAEFDRQLASYCAALDAGPGPGAVAEVLALYPRQRGEHGEYDAGLVVAAKQLSGQELQADVDDVSGRTTGVHWPGGAGRAAHVPHGDLVGASRPLCRASGARAYPDGQAGKPDR